MQVHLSPAQPLILSLKAVRVGSFLTLLSGVLQSKLPPLMDSDSCPQPFVFICGILQRFVSLDYKLNASLHEIPFHELVGFQGNCLLVAWLHLPANLSNLSGLCSHLAVLSSIDECILSHFLASICPRL